MSPNASPSSRAATRLTAVVVGVALVAGVVLRFVTASHLWLDEALSVNIAALDPGDIVDALRRDGHPPLYYWLLHGWQAVVGDGDLAVRSLSGLLSLLTLPLLFVAGRRLGGSRLGWAAVALAAVNPYVLRYATEARMYALVSLLVLAGWLLVDAALRRPRVVTLAGTAAVTAALVLTHYWSFWLLATAGALLVVIAVRAQEPDRRRAARLVLAAMAVGALAFLPWLPVFLEQAAHTATPWADPSRPSQVVALTLQDLGGGTEAEALLLSFALGVLVLVGVLGRGRGPWVVELDLRTRADTRTLAILAGGTLVIGAVVALVAGSAFATRYAAVVVPFLLLLAAAGVDRLDGAGARVVVLGATVALSLAVSVHDARDDRTQAGEIAAAIEAGDPAGGPVGERPVVVYCPDQLGPAVDRLLPDDRFDQVVYPELDLAVVDAPRRIDWYDYADRQQAATPEEVADAVLARAGDDTAVWVVFSPTYRTVDDRCTELVVALGERRPGIPVVTEDAQRFFEHAGLQLYPPPAP